MAMVELKNIRKKLGGVDILNGVDLSVEEGEVVVILGPSGSGKTTLLRTINFLAPADQGTITIDGLTVDSQKHHHKETLALRRKTGMVFQNYNLFRNKTVIQNITEGLTTVRKIPHEQAVETAMALLKKVNLENRASAYPAQLSGGQQQRVALARMMIGEPEVILLDEPFSALDGYLKDIMQRDMQNFLKEYTGDMILVTHSRDEAYKFCGHLTILDSGQALTTGETKKLFERPGILQAARLTGCKNFSAVQKMGEHNIYAVDWDLMLQTKDVVPDDVTHVGIRGHWMKGSSEGGENRMEVEVVEYIETTFEHQYLLKNKKGGDCQPVWWMCPKEDFEEDPHTKVPKYIHFPAEHLMLLKEAK